MPPSVKRVEGTPAEATTWVAELTAPAPVDEAKALAKSLTEGGTAVSAGVIVHEGCVWLVVVFTESKEKFVARRTLLRRMKRRGLALADIQALDDLHLGLWIGKAEYSFWPPNATLEVAPKTHMSDQRKLAAVLSHCPGLATKQPDWCPLARFAGAYASTFEDHFQGARAKESGQGCLLRLYQMWARANGAVNPASWASVSARTRRDVDKILQNKPHCLVCGCTDFDGGPARSETAMRHNGQELERWVRGTARRRCRDCGQDEDTPHPESAQAKRQRTS